MSLPCLFHDVIIVINVAIAVILIIIATIIIIIIMCMISLPCWLCTSLLASHELLSALAPTQSLFGSCTNAESWPCKPS